MHNVPSRSLALVTFLAALTPRISFAQYTFPQDVNPTDTPTSCPNCLQVAGSVTLTWTIYYDGSGYPIAYTLPPPFTVPSGSIVDSVAVAPGSVQTGVQVSSLGMDHLGAQAYLPLNGAPVTYPFYGQTVAGTWNLSVWLYSVQPTGGSLTVKVAINYHYTQVPSPDYAVNVSPLNASTTQGASTDFTITVTPLNGFTGTVNILNVGNVPANASWTVSSWTISASSSWQGTLTLYANNSEPGTYFPFVHTASGPLDKNTSFKWVVTSPPVTVSVTPSNVTLITNASTQFSAEVTGTANTGVAWSVSEGAAGGSITSTGIYTAPSNPGTYHVVATSVADPTKIATATVTCVRVSVSLTPTDVLVVTNASTQFSAQVTGSTNTGVTWSVREGAEGGSITSTGTYTAPSTPGVYHVVATSDADPRASASADALVVCPTGYTQVSGICVPPHTWVPGTWQPVPSGTPNGLTAVWGSSSTDVWAVGRQGTIVHWNGDSWSLFSSGTTAALDAVWGSAANDVWAVGTGGTIVHWNGTSWSRSFSGTTDQLSSLWGSSTNDLWAVSASGGILHWNGSVWSTVLSGRSALTAIWGSGASDVWVAGVNTTLHWNGSAWSSVPGPFFDVAALWGTGPSDIWAVGGYDDGYENYLSAVFHWDGQAWSAAAGGTMGGFSCVWGSAANDIWVGGGTGMLRWDGSGWSPISLPGVSGIWGSAANDVWAVVGYPGGSVYHWYE
jgi:hypothetical protein